MTIPAAREGGRDTGQTPAPSAELIEIGRAHV